MVVNLMDYLSLNRIQFSNALTKEAVITELIRVTWEDGKVENMEGFRNALLKRESIMTTGIGYGVAIPHVKLPIMKDFFITISIHKNGVNWDSLDSKPVHFIILIAGPTNKQEKYLRILAKLMLVLKRPESRQKLLQYNTKYDIYNIFKTHI